MRGGPLARPEVQVASRRVRPQGPPVATAGRVQRAVERLGLEDEPAATLDAAEGEAARAAFAAAIARALGRAG